LEKKTASGQPSLLESILSQLVEEHRVADDRFEKTRVIMIDSQSVPNADTAFDQGDDGGKKVSGIKRHLAVDTQGLPHTIHVTTANVTCGPVPWKLFKNRMNLFLESSTF